MTTNTATTAARGPLCAATMDALRSYFAERHHRPSPAHWAALEDIARTMEDMANEVCPAKVMLSSCDPGTGKTQTVRHFAQALIASQDHRHVGMLLCVGRLDEARTLIGELDLPPGSLGVFTADKADTNTLATATPNEAQVLITTQQMVERRSKNGFADATEFHYYGKPRQVRVWDEAWLPGTAISLNRYDLSGLFKPLHVRCPAMADEVEDLFAKLRDAADGSLIPVPDWQASFGLGLHEALGAVNSGRDDDRAALTGLYVLSGRMGRVKHDGRHASAMLTYKDTLPSDLYPLLVLDASGRVRNTYTDVERHRRMLVRLRSAAKDYSPLKVHVWQTAGSKSGWQKRGAELVDGIVRTILSKPDEPWLIVHHKASQRVPDVPAEVLRQLPTDARDRVSFITWGRHMAVNTFADVPNVILAGTLFMRPSFYTALTHLAQGKPADRYKMPDDAVARTIIGEHRNLLLQAVCRGRVRKLDGDKCLPMDAYVIASPASGIPAALASIFPGCQVRRWEPLERKLAGKLKAAVEMVEKAFAGSVLDWLPLKTVRDAIGVKRENFGREVTKRPEWLDAIASLGLEIARGRRGVLGLRLLPDAAIREAAA